MRDEKELKLEKFKELVLFYNEKFNLTAIKDDKEFYAKHFEDSLLPSKSVDFNNKKIMDIGSGAGFPGIPLAIYFPNSSFYLVEPTTKRANFLEIVKNELNLENVFVINKRVEDLKKDNSYKDFDLVVSRAVSELVILLELSIPYLKVGGKLVAYKGLNYEEEIKRSENALKTLKCDIDFIQKEKLSLNDETRFNIIIKKEGVTPSIYPRNFGAIKKRPLL